MDIELLTAAGLAEWCQRIDAPAEALPALVETAAQIRAEAGLLALFSAFHEQTALRGEWRREWSPLPFDPLVTERLGERASQFYLLAYLAALPYTWASYQRRGISPQIFQDTMLDFRFYMEDYYHQHGVWGYALFSWIWRHLAGDFFRLGRLQYMLIPFSGGVTALRQRASGTVRLLADPTLRLRPDGRAWGAGQPNGSELPSGPGTWTPLFEAGPQGWRGHEVSPYGQVQAQAGFWPAAEWELLLQRGDTVLDLHIPRTAPFQSAVCGASYGEARAFFARFYPENPPKALFCHTWMFTPQLQELLPPESNLVRFQREFYLYPHPGNENFLWSFVFSEQTQRALAPRDTRLRRAVLDWLEAGKEIFDLPGLLFHPPAAWGSQPYMGERGPRSA